MSIGRRIYRALHVGVIVVALTLAACSRGADSVSDKLTMYVPDDAVAVVTADISALPDEAVTLPDLMDIDDIPLLRAVMASAALERTNCVMAMRRVSGRTVSAMILSVNDEDAFVDGLVRDAGLVRGEHDGAECALGAGVAVVADGGVAMVIFGPGRMYTAQDAVARMLSWGDAAAQSPLSSWKAAAVANPSPVAFYGDVAALEHGAFGTILDFAPEAVRGFRMLGDITVDGPCARAVVRFVRQDGTSAGDVFGNGAVDTTLMRYVHANEWLVLLTADFEACYDRFRPAIAEAGFDELMPWARPGPAVLAFGPRGGLDMSVFAEPSVADWDFTAVYALGKSDVARAIASIGGMAKDAGVSVVADRSTGGRIVRVPAGYDFSDEDDEPRMIYIDVYVIPDGGNLVLSTRPVARGASVPSGATDFAGAVFAAGLDLPAGTLRPFGCDAGVEARLTAAGDSVVVRVVATGTDNDFFKTIGPIISEIL